MAIRIKLYGDLREKAPSLKNNHGVPSTLDVEASEMKTVLDVLNKFNITEDEISHIFVNSRYSGIEREVKTGDRIGIFPKRMGLIFVEIMNE